VNTPISLGKQRAVTRALKAQKAMKICDILSPSPNYETRAVERSYVAVAHTDLEADIRGMTGFTPVAEYGQRELICEHEIGAVEDVRYCLSPDLDPILAGGAAVGVSGMVSQGGTSVDIYPVLYFGKEAYGTVGLKGQGAISPSIIPVGQKTKDDPLGQRGLIGAQTYFTCVRLNELHMAVIECACTFL
jgi:N4-gp56 family major capsid protein